MFTLTYGTFSLLLGTLTLQGEGGQETAIFLVTCSAIFLIKQKRGGGQKVWKYVYVIYEWLLRKETVADFLANLFKKNSNRGDFINLAQKQLIGQSVMTSYRYWLELIKVKEQFLFFICNHRISLKSSPLMFLLPHRLDRVEFRIFVVVFFSQAHLKKSKQTFDILNLTRSNILMCH